MRCLDRILYAKCTNFIALNKYIRKNNNLSNIIPHNGYGSGLRGGFMTRMFQEYSGIYRHTILISLLSIGVILLSGGFASVWADNPSGTALEPGHIGTDYTFQGDYSNGTITINGSGMYFLMDNLTTSSPGYGIQVNATDISLNGNGKNLTGTGPVGFNNFGVCIITTEDNITVNNFGSITGFTSGIYSMGEGVIISGNTIKNTISAIRTRGVYAVIRNNVITDTETGITSEGRYATVSGNIVVNSTDEGIVTSGRYASIQGNTVQRCSTGILGSGYYGTDITGNTVEENTYAGIYSSINNARIQDNSANNNNIGIYLRYNSINTSVRNNTILHNSLGIYFFDMGPTNVEITGNNITGHTGIWIRPPYAGSETGGGNGSIFDNFLANEINVAGSGMVKNFTWTNPSGPVPGTNIMGGPFRAGNYWSDPDGTGWSDLQEPLETGYSSVPYEVFMGSGAWDTAPLIRIANTINSSSDDWTINYPHGNISYPRYSNATYITQAKPGADIVNVSVDDEFVGPVSNWTFTNITSNHAISSVGEPTPGQVHAFFTLNQTWGAAPMTVLFTNQSLGDPTSFFWYFGDGGDSTERDPIHTYLTPGTYTVSLHAMNDKTGGIATLNNALTVTAGIIPSPQPTPVPGAITVAFSADHTSGSAPLQVTFTDHSTGSPTAWNWDFGDGSRSVMQNVTHVYTRGGDYQVSLTATNSISSGRLEKNDYISIL